MPPQVVQVKDAGKIATALANEKCQRILDHLRENEDATETQLAGVLKIPLSTVHYNMKTLVEAKLVHADTYSYSSRGKEVTHYRISKNPIVIVQENQQLAFLKAITPAALIAAAAGAIYQLVQQNFAASIALGTVSAENARMMAPESSATADSFAAAAPKMAAFASNTAQTVSETSALGYFIGGIISVLILSLIVLSIYQWWNNRQA